MTLDPETTEYILQAKRDLLEAAEGYHLGVYTRADVYSRYVAVLYRGLDELLKYKKGLYCLFGDAAYHSFAEEYSAFENGALREELSDHPWLFRDDRPDASEWTRRTDVYRADSVSLHLPATVHDRYQFFSVMEAIHLPVAFFQPILDTVIRPHYRQVHAYGDGETILIDFVCVNDGGLTEDPNPIGKTFLLTNELNLQARITIAAVRSKDEIRNRRTNDADDCFPLGQYLGEGSVQGYTSAADRPIVIRADAKGQIAQLGTVIGGKDRGLDDYDQGVSGYPLWQPYYRMLQDRENRMQERIVDSILRSTH